MKIQNFSKRYSKVPSVAKGFNGRSSNLTLPIHVPDSTPTLSVPFFSQGLMDWFRGSPSYYLELFPISYDAFQLAENLIRRRVGCGGQGTQDSPGRCSEVWTMSRMPQGWVHSSSQYRRMQPELIGLWKMGVLIHLLHGA